MQEDREEEQEKKEEEQLSLRSALHSHSCIKYTDSCIVIKQGFFWPLGVALGHFFSLILRKLLKMRSGLRSHSAEIGFPVACCAWLCTDVPEDGQRKYRTKGQEQCSFLLLLLPLLPFLGFHFLLSYNFGSIASLPTIHFQCDKRLLSLRGMLKILTQ